MTVRTPCQSSEQLRAAGDGEWQLIWPEMVVVVHGGAVGDLQRGSGAREDGRHVWTHRLSQAARSLALQPALNQISHVRWSINPACIQRGLCGDLSRGTRYWG